MIIHNNNARILAWIAIPRTGTNFLCSLVYHHPLINSYYEIFHPQRFYSGYQNKEQEIIKYINYKYKQNFSSPGDANLIQWIHKYPDKLFSVLLYFNPNKYISFKLFPDHLEQKNLQSSIINNNKVKKILVKRNLLSTYISHEIALKINQWDNFDTSEIKISISLFKFERWINKIEQWYQLFENYNDLGEAEYHVLNYEDIHAYQANIDKLGYLDRFFQSIGVKSQQEYQLPSNDTIQIMNKQDKRTNLAEKIINYQEFIQGIEERGLAKRLGFKPENNYFLDQ